MFFAPLSNSIRTNSIPFKNWWSQLVFRWEDDLKFSRRRLVLQMANKEGGSHVDPKLTPDFVEVQKNSLGFKFINDSEEIGRNDVASVTIRQIAHEVLESLVDGYKKAPDTSGVGIIIAGVSFSSGSGNIGVPKIGMPRNSPCPCESGLKYKKCHGFV